MADSETFLTTPRLELRWWRMEDLPLAQQLWCDPQVMHYLGGAYSAQKVAERLAWHIGLGAGQGMQYWPVFEREGGGFVGATGLRPSDLSPFRHGFHLLRKHWGRGYGYEAASAVLRYGFETLGAPEITAGRHPDNAASGRLLEKLGFVHVVSRFYEDSGLWHPNYELTRGRFLQHSAHC